MTGGTEAGQASSPLPPGRRLDLHLQLLDHQVVDQDGNLLCTIDDLELDLDADGLPVVRALLVGPLALGRRLGGRLGRWWAAVPARLSPRAQPAPVRIPMSEVIDYGSAVVVGRPERHRPLEFARTLAPLEDWLVRHVIGRIPGNRHESE